MHRFHKKSRFVPTLTAVTIFVAATTLAGIWTHHANAWMPPSPGKDAFQKGSADIETNQNSSTWKALIQAGKQPYHKLTSDDFQVNDSISSNSKVMTMSFIECTYRYRFVPGNEGSIRAVLEDFKVFSGLDSKKCWRRSWFTDPRIYLNHEQGHADINEIEARTFAATIATSQPEGIGSTTSEAIKNLESKLHVIYDKVATENQTWQINYDDFTSTGLDAAAQKRATSALQVRLTEAGIGIAPTETTIHSQVTSSAVVF